VSRPNEGHAYEARSMSFTLFAINPIGLGLGPTAAAVFTDYVFNDDNMV